MKDWVAALIRGEGMNWIIALIAAVIGGFAASLTAYYFTNKHRLNLRFDKKQIPDKDIRG